MKTKDILAGIDIIRKYVPEKDKGGWYFSAEHDIIWFGDEEWVTDKKDITTLQELGWFIDEESWACHT